MEIALLRAGQRLGVVRRELLKARPFVRKYPFDAARKMMATLHRQEQCILFAVKGAPETVLRLAEQMTTADDDTAMTDAMRAKWLDRVEQLGHRGLRVLACASKTSACEEDDPYQGLTFLGLITLEDPARADVPQAVPALWKPFRAGQSHLLQRRSIAIALWPAARGRARLLAVQRPHAQAAPHAPTNDALIDDIL